MLEHREHFPANKNMFINMYSTYLHEKENISQNIFLDALLVSCLCALKYLIAKSAPQCTDLDLDSCSAFSVVALAI